MFGSARQQLEEHVCESIEPLAGWRSLAVRRSLAASEPEPQEALQVERLLLLQVRVRGLRWRRQEAGHWLRGLREEALLLLEQYLLQLCLLLLGTRSSRVLRVLQLLQLLQLLAQAQRRRGGALLWVACLLLRMLLLALRLKLCLLKLLLQMLRLQL